MKKVGILGGGQLGRMLLQAAANYPVITYILDNDLLCPSAHLCHHFIKGDITDYNDVYTFGKNCDVLTIEIENVNIEALSTLEAEGKTIIPSAATLRTIKNKILQKEFYKAHEIPTSDFVITQSKIQFNQHVSYLPAVHKLASGGYDGRGVQLIQSLKEADLAFDEPAVLEKMVNIKQEISIIIGRNIQGDTAIYAPVEMVFDQQLNQLSHQITPAKLEENIFWKAEAIALMVVKHLKSPGLFAVELFVDVDGNVLVNETAPRVHNSGHHTIEACYSSQFDMLWRILLDYPLGNTDLLLPAALVNITGDAEFNGAPVYKGLKEILAMDNVFIHIYGKQFTKPGRKMGHITIMSNEKQELIHKANLIKNLIGVQS